MNQNKFIVKSLLMRGTTFPCFLWPAVDAGDGSLKFPISNEENVIKDFSPIKEIEKYNLRIDDIDVKYESITLQIDKDTRFAYAFSYDDYRIGTIKEIKRFVDGRKEIDELNIYKKYELFCAIKDNKSVCDFLEDIVREDHSQYSPQEKKWAEYELNYLRKMQKASTSSDVWIDHVKKIFNNIKQVAEGSMPAKDAEYEFCRFARQYTTDSSELERSMRETIELILNIKARVTELEANNDSLRNENVELRQELKVISTKLAESYTQSIDQCDVPYQTSPVWDYSEEYDVEKTCVKLSQKKTSTMAIFAAWKSPFARDTRFFVRFKKRQPNQPMGSQRTGDEFFSRSLPRGTL